MVRLIICFLITCFPLSAFSSTDLSLNIEQDKQQLGYAFNATLIASNIRENLSSIDLSPLHKDFGIIINEYSGNQNNIKTESQQQLTLKLYPRRTGLIQVPQLQFSSASSKPVDVEVKPAITTSGPINLKYNVSTLQPWQRQQVLVTVNVTTPDKFSRLETKAPQDADSEYRNIPATKQAHSTITHLNTGWTIFPLRSGTHNFSPPPVLYHLQGVVERRFYLPTIQLNVKPLPSYIPPLMPVGRVFIESSIGDVNLLNTGTIYNWVIRLHSPELLSHYLPPILRQVASDDNIEFYPAQSIRNEGITISASNGEVIHSIPFKITSSGKKILPKLHLQYFDPVLGRVAVTSFTSKPMWGLSIYWQIIFGIIFLIVLLYLIKIIWKYWICFHKRHKHMQDAIHLITNASESKNLRDAMHSISMAEGWPTNLSMEKWSGKWECYYSTSITKTIQNISRTYYTNSSEDIASIKHDFLEVIRKRKTRRMLSKFICDCTQVS